MTKSDNSRAIGRHGRLDELQEYDSRQWSWSLPLCDLIRIVRVTSDPAVSFVGVQSAAFLGIKQGQPVLTIKGCKFHTPLSDGWLVADPNFACLRIKFVAEAERQNFITSVKEVMSIFFSLRIGVVSAEQLRERVVTTRFKIRHVGILP